MLFEVTNSSVVNFPVGVPNFSLVDKLSIEPLAAKDISIREFELSIAFKSITEKPSVVFIAVVENEVPFYANSVLISPPK
jgi:hypothetical protein